MGLFGKLLNRTQAVTCALPDNHPVMKRIDGLLGISLAATPEYQQALFPALNAAVAALEAEVAKIPGPFDITAAHYLTDSFEHALFDSRQEIAHGLGQSGDVKVALAFLAAGGQSEAFALLGVRRQLPAEDGGVKGYCDHTLHALGATENSTRRALRDEALMALLSSVEANIEKMRRGGVVTRLDWRPFEALSNSAEPVNATTELAVPALVATLAAWFGHPEHALRIDLGHGVVVSAASDATPPVGLPVLHSRDRRKWLVCIAHLPVAEAVAAMRHEPNQTRRISI